MHRQDNEINDQPELDEQRAEERCVIPASFACGQEARRFSPALNRQREWSSTDVIVCRTLRRPFGTHHLRSPLMCQLFKLLSLSGIFVRQVGGLIQMVFQVEQQLIAEVVGENRDR